MRASTCPVPVVLRFGCERVDGMAAACSGVEAGMVLMIEQTNSGRRETFIGLLVVLGCAVAIVGTIYLVGFLVDGLW